MNKIELFQKELQYIKSSKIGEAAHTLVELLPDYFFSIPASSTGKYHPSFAQGEKGLIRHTKVAVRMAYTILNNESLNDFTSDEKDLIFLALILHDGCKSGLVKTEYTVVNHPLIVSKLIKDNSDKLKLTDDELNFLTSVIETHMGPWNKDYKGNTILPVPATKAQKFVHLCDYLASQKFLDVKFSNNDIID